LTTVGAKIDGVTDRKFPIRTKTSLLYIDPVYGELNTLVDRKLVYLWLVADDDAADRLVIIRLLRV
jgi:hypothetical protein